MGARKVLITIGIVVAMPSLAACFDLFHATDDIKNVCDVDASASDACAVSAEAATPDDGGGDEPEAAPAMYNTSDFCSNDSPSAYAAAERACQLLGACGGPIGNNQFARCMPRAIMAYDCSAAPERRVSGSVRSFWKCLADAKSCGDLHACSALPALGCDTSKGAYSVCGGGSRLVCTGPDAGSLALVEPCAGWGQACAANANNDYVCAGPTGGTCASDACNGTAVTSCDAKGNNVGVDCAGFGGGQCVTVGGSPACTSAGDACAPSTEVACRGGVAAACLSGKIEHVDCTKVTAGKGICASKSAAAPSWYLAEACLPHTSCPLDSCEGRVLNSCADGLVFQTVCPKGCVAGIVTPDSESPHAACRP